MVAFWPVLILILSGSYWRCTQEVHATDPHRDLIDSSCIYLPTRTWHLDQASSGDYCAISHQLSGHPPGQWLFLDSIYKEFVQLGCDSSSTWPQFQGLLRKLEKCYCSLYLEVAGVSLDRFGATMSPDDKERIESCAVAATCSVYGAHSLESIRAKQQLADHYRVNQRYLRADTFYQQCIDGLMSGYPDSIAWLERCLSYHGTMKRHQSEYDNALADFRLCRNLIARMGDYSRLAFVYNEESIIQGNSGNLPRSLILVDSALIFGKKYQIPGQVAKSYLIKGTILSLQRRYQDAHHLFLENLHDVSTPDKKLEIYGKIISNLVRLNQLDSAQKYLELADTEGIKTPKTLAYFNFQCSQYFRSRNDFNEALEAINKALALTNPGLGPTLHSIKAPEKKRAMLDEWALFYLGQKGDLMGNQYLLTGDSIYLDSCLDHYAYIDDYIRDHFRYSDTGDELHAVDLLNEMYFKAMSILVRVAERGRTAAFDNLLNAYGERMRFRKLFQDFDLLEAVSDRDPHLKEIVEALIDNRNLVPVTWNPNQNLVGNEYASDRQKNVLLDSLAKNYPLILEMYFQRKEVTTREVLDWNKANKATTIALFSNHDGDVIGLVYGEKVHAFYEPASEPAEMEWYNQINQPILDEKSWPEHLLLADRIRSMMDTSTSNVVFLAEGDLEKIPFGKYFNDRYSVYYGYTLARLVSAPVEQTLKLENHPLLSFVHSDKRGADLPYTYREGNWLQNNYPESRVFFGEDATIRNFNKYRSEYDVYHFALHGINNQSNPAASGIQFRDGLLDIVQISKENWTGKTIILNICDAGTGPSASGAGVLSIAKAFINAKLIIAPIYRLDDDQGFKGIKAIANHQRMDEQYRWIIY